MLRHEIWETRIDSREYYLADLHSKLTEQGYKFDDKRYTRHSIRTMSRMLTFCLIRMPLRDIWLHRKYDSETKTRSAVTILLGGELIYAYHLYAVERAFALTEINIWAELEGKMYSDLEFYMRRRIDERECVTHYFDSKTPIGVIDAYLRLNEDLNREV